ncbi:YjcZ family sporulation protein [Rossellomorea sp. BNER]|nr:YjcZ family sporulation protein [Rossellomorea sp. BNER]
MYQGYDNCCYGGYGYPVAGVADCGYGSGFALIVVLFILLIIIGACYSKC